MSQATAARCPIDGPPNVGDVGVVVSKRAQISNVAIAEDGHAFERSRMEDFQTLERRWVAPVQRYLDESAIESVFFPGYRAYEAADYESALGWFVRAIEMAPQLEAILLHTHVGFCRQVIATELDDQDLAWTDRRRPRRFAWLLSRDEPAKERCKWCGHFTTYLNPDWGDGWRGENTCERCGWNFPMPGFAWDSPDGLAYSCYRGSFSCHEFYDWFERVFDVAPGRDHYKLKSGEDDHRAFQTCPECGKVCVGVAWLDQHRRAKHRPDPMPA
jgi:hypothetical protein